MQIEIPGYRIIRTLGKGGMASVYLAIQESFEREVALKVMAPELSKDAAFGERFLREARIVSRLIHPNIVTVYDVGIHEGYYFLSMEYVPGQDLTRKRFDLSLADSLNVVKDIARALDFAGTKGYVHRDVKPENIMLRDESGRAVLMDFGIARPSDVASGMTQTGMAIGTPHYMSPEQAKGLPVDTRADIYSLGVVLFLLLTGRVPYHADSAVVVGIMHVSEDIPRLPPHLQVFQAIIDCVLAKNPLARYQTGAELIEDLDAISAQDIAEAAELREQTQQDAEESNSVRSDDTPGSISYTQAASFFSTAETAPTLLTTKIPVPVEPESKADGDVSDVSESAEKPKLTGNPKTVEQNEAMVVSAEDRVGRSSYRTEVAEKKSAHVGRLLILLLLILAAAGYYFRADITHWLAPHLAPVAEEVSIENEPLDTQPQDIRLQDTQLQGNKPQTSPPQNNPAPDEQASAIPPTDSEGPETELSVIDLPAPTTADTAGDLPPSESSPTAQDLPVPAETIAEIDSTPPQMTPEEDEAAQQQAREAQTQREREAEQERKALAERAQRLAAEQALLDEAKTQTEAGQLIAPRGDNALETYRILLGSNPGHVAARKGEADIEKMLVDEIQGLLRAENFSSATTRLASAREHFPQSQALLSLNLDLDQAILNNLPRVARLAVTSTETGVIEEQQPTIAADRNIYIGFEYRNFKAETSLIQAILYDGSRSHQIVQVPVIVTGSNGMQFFRMEQPVAGFAEGGYSIDLLLDNQLLITARFSVRKPQ